MILTKQAKVRKNLAEAAAKYVNLRAADGTYTDTVATVDRLGRKVIVFITLEIISGEG